MTGSAHLRTLRFGILCNSIELEAWQVSCLQALIQVQGCVPIVAVLNATPQPRAPLLSRLARLLSKGRLGWAVFDRLVASPPSAATRKVSPPEWLRDLQRMECVVVKKGRYSEYFIEEDIERLGKMSLDFLVKFGFGITRGAILDIARYGVWSFHHDDETRYRGAPPCFWEIYRGDPVTGSILQRLTEKLDGGVVLKRGYFQTILHSYVRNRDQAYVGSAVWPAQVCRDILNGEADYLTQSPTSSNARIYRYPDNLQMTAFVFRLARNCVKMQLEDLLFCDMWNIGVLNEPVEVVARRGVVDNIHWMDPPGGDRYLADPSGVSIGGESWILAEDYSYLGGRGVIAARRLAGGATNGAWRTVIDIPYHLSFPQILEHNKQLYCLPECAASGEITLYRAEPFPDRWVPIATLVPHFAGVDSTLCFHDGRWWLFCTDLERGDRSHLHVFYADALTGPYTPHCNNPVKIDIRGSRPAGPLFRLDGAWIRPAQNDAETYGRSITLNKIVRMTPEAFQEEIYGELLPDPRSPFPRGLHTIHGLGEVTLIDGKRRRFVARVFAKRALDKVSKLLPGQGAGPVRRS